MFLSSIVLAAGDAAAKPMLDWAGFGTVGLVTLVGAGFVVVMYSLGVRFTAVAAEGNRLAHWGSYVCFTLCVIAVAIGIILIVPFLSDLVGGWVGLDL